MKIAFVVQRYGDEVNGGAEAHCRQIAERLAALYEVDVLSTCALDYQTWENEYRPGKTSLRGVTLRRFPVDCKRNPYTFEQCYNFLVAFLLWRRNQGDTHLSDAEHVQRLLYPITDRERSTQREPSSLLQRLELKLLQSLAERFWMRMQGPVSQQLVRYLKKHRRSYDAFFFFSYNYATTYYGLPIVADRAALIPTLHEEACVAFHLYKRTFRQARYILFNSHEERTFAESQFPFLRKKPGDIVGLGVESQRPTSEPLLAQRYGLEAPYLLYLGRIEPSKGFPLLFESFLHFKAHYSKPLKLLLLGKAEIPIPEHPDIVALGFVDEEVKGAALAGALALVMPSFYESLSMVVLEAWLAKIPVLVNDRCRVLAAHCEKSQGGLCFHDASTFANALHKIVGYPELRRTMAEAGHAYVRRTYTWDSVIAKYRQIVQGLAEHSFT